MMETKKNILKTFLQAPINSQTYLNLIYLLLAFPLGLSYFLFLVIGFSVGIPLSIFIFGLFILAAIFAASWGLTAFERQLAIALLRVKIAPMNKPAAADEGFWKKLGGFFSNPVTWKGLFYLFLKFPVGIISFVITVTGLATTFSLLTAPLFYRLWTINFGFWRIDTLTEALLAVPLGFIMIFVVLNIFNLAAWLSGQLARVMLGRCSLDQNKPAVFLPQENETNKVSENETKGTAEEKVVGEDMSSQSEKDKELINNNENAFSETANPTEIENSELE